MMINKYELGLLSLKGYWDYSLGWWSGAVGSQSMVCLHCKVGTALCEHLYRGNLTSIASALFFCII